MNLTTERLQICTISAAELELYCQIYCDPTAMQFVAPAYDRAKAERCFAHALKQSHKAEQNLRLMSIAWRACGRKIGICGYQRLAQAGNVFEPGFMLLPGTQSQGVGTEVVAALCEALFRLPNATCWPRETNLKESCQTAATEIWLQYRADNVAADRLVKRLGFTVEYQTDPNAGSAAIMGRVTLRR